VPTISSSSLKIEDGDAVQDKTERYFPFLRVTADAGGPGGWAVHGLMISDSLKMEFQLLSLPETSESESFKYSFKLWVWAYSQPKFSFCKTVSESFVESMCYEADIRSIVSYSFSLVPAFKKKVSSLIKGDTRNEL